MVDSNILSRLNRDPKDASTSKPQNLGMVPNKEKGPLQTQLEMRRSCWISGGP